MRHGILGTPTLLALMAAPSAQAQCVECSMQNFNSTLSGITTYNTNVDRVQEGERRAHDRRARAASAPAGTAAASLEDRVLDAVMAPLLVEADRRVATDGKAAAEAWYVAAGRELGGKAGSLMPEYRRRVAADGQANAESWYVAAAGELSRRYIQSGH
ncbi:hypothetical protein [Inquilinus sp.]|jgi:hypothetical protein|uniref:hypothetical protein n=1 Tax=Inquilinus sp. TaxID=1932117 RepID=UPI003783C7E4